MSIISSSVAIDAHVQSDGSRYVVERHEDSAGAIYQFLYLAPVGFDVNTRLAARSAELAITLADIEADAVTSNG